MSNKNRFELTKVLKQRQDKFVYYIIGLCVASIGFSLSKTFEDSLDFNHTPLGIALLCWFLSIISGMRWIYLQMGLMQHNLDLSDLINGLYDKTKMNEVQKLDYINSTRDKLQKGGDSCERALNTMIFTFLMGIVSFVFWRVLEMI